MILVTGATGRVGYRLMEALADARADVTAMVRVEAEAADLPGSPEHVVASLDGPPPASVLLKRAAGIAKGSGTPNKDKVGKVTEKQVLDIAKQKMPDLNAASIESAIRSVKGTARSMGIDVVA